MTGSNEIDTRAVTPKENKTVWVVEVDGGRRTATRRAAAAHDHTISLARPHKAATEALPNERDTDRDLQLILDRLLI